MTNEPSPRPWRMESDNLTLRPPVCFVVDANGAKVSGGFFSRADATLIVDAVNRFLHGEDAPITPCHSGRDGQFRGVPDRQDGNTRTSGDGTERRASLLLPWTVEGPFTGLKPTRKRDGFPAYSNIVNRVGVYVTQNLQPEVAALIVDAVNERDRLRDIVRRFADLTDNLIANYEYRYRDDQNSMAFVGNVRAFIREARAAIGEDAP